MHLLSRLGTYTPYQNFWIEIDAEYVRGNGFFFVLNFVLMKKWVSLGGLSRVWSDGQKSEMQSLLLFIYFGFWRLHYENEFFFDSTY